MRGIGATLGLLLVLGSVGCASVDEKLAAELEESVLVPLEAARQAGDDTEIKRQCTAFEMALEAPDVKKNLSQDGPTKAVVTRLREACAGVDTGVTKRHK